MRNRLGQLIVTLLLPAFSAYAQVAPKPAEPNPDQTYERLLQYQGLYEYVNDTTLRIAASPAEQILYALVFDAKYPIRPRPEADTFTDVSNQPVLFVRDAGDGITGYKLASSGSDHVFRRLSSDVHFPKEMWYPRMPGTPTYAYAPPRDLGDGLPVGSIGPGLDRVRIEEMIRLIASGGYPDVHSVLILQHGNLVLEEYFYEYDANTVHPLRSATKSFISALTGIAIDQGSIKSVRQPVLPYFQDDYKSIGNFAEAKRKITIEDLLTHSSGLDCNDEEPKSAGNESRMAYSEDWVKFVLDLPMLHEPGTVSTYCSGGVILLGRIIEKATGIKIEDFARERLFKPLGIDRFEWRFDPDKSSAETFIQISLRPRDMAKFGLLFSQGGRWNGRQILPAKWVEASLARHSTVNETDYGYLWWRQYLNVPGGRHQGIVATGNGGQKIYLWPDLDLIVVTTGGNYNKDSHADELLIRYILPPIPAQPGR
jgi:CubicO group peptidase (beta-lactamase class C family)